MRHRVVGKKLNRDSGHRNAMKRTMADQLFEHGKIETTVTKAKWLRPYAEKLITKAKKAHTAEDTITKFNFVKALRAELRQETTLKKLVEDIAPSFKDREGGYTKITKLGFRGGDQAQKARIELVTEEKKKTEKKATKKKAHKAKVEETPEVEVKAEETEVVEETKEENTDE